MSRLIPELLSTIALLAFWATAPKALLADDLLELDVPYRHELRAGDFLVLHFNSEANNNYLIEVDQGGLDLTVTLEAPAGASQTFNSPVLRDESEIIVADARHSGTFTLRITSDEHTGATGTLTARLLDLSALANGDGRYEKALRLISDAAAHNHAGTTEGWKRAITAYEEAAELLEDSIHKREWARCLFSVATIEYWQMLQWDKAARLAAQATQIYEEIGQRQLAANALHLQAAALIEKANEIENPASGGIAAGARDLFDRALFLFREAREEQKQLEHPYDAALITNNIGLTYYYMGDWPNAAPRFEKAARQFREIDEWSAELMSLGNLAVIDFERGNLVTAIETFNRILELLPPGKSPRYRADTLDNLGASYLSLGQLDEALRSFSNALSRHREMEDVKGEARSLAGIGTVYFGIGEQELALDYLQRALTATRKARDARAQVSVLNFVGNLRRQLGEPKKALQAHQEAQQLATAPIDQARAQVYAAQDLIAADQGEKALEVLTLADSVAREVNNRKLMADVARVSGEARLVLGDYERSVELFGSAKDRYLALGLQSEQAQATFGLARASWKAENQEQGIDHAKSAINLVENLRSQLINPELRAFFLAARQSYYDFLIDALMVMHEESPEGSEDFLRQALFVSERSRARALVDLINELSVVPDHAAKPSTQERTQRLYRQLSEARYRLHSALEEPGERGQPGRKSPEAIRQELASIENQLNLLQIENRERNPALANLVDPQILDAAEIQKQLDEESALLHFDLGEHRSFVWQITQESIDAWSLPDRHVIEEGAREAYGLLQVPSFSEPARKKLARSLDHLSSQLLSSIEAPSQTRILIVAEGVLQYLPFSLLHLTNSSSERQPLLATHELVYLPSMSVLAAQRGHQPNRQSPLKTVAVFADPVLTVEDSRLSGLVGKNAGPNSESLPQALALNRPELRRLPATRQEAQTIAELVPPDQRLLALGFDANREAVLGPLLKDFRIVHFATHGLIDSRYPALSSLAFSQFDASGEPREGLVRLHDIYNLKLNADLVALSACDTALGRQILGEGLTGLTQGLIYAGSRTVLASLWQVPDRATAELMRRFYQNLLDLGQRPATALRNAQRDLSAEPRWRSPYFWGAFVLQGEWQ